MSLREILDYIYDIKKEIERLKDRIASLEAQVADIYAKYAMLSGSYNNYKTDMWRTIRNIEERIAELELRRKQK